MPRRLFVLLVAGLALFVGLAGPASARPTTETTTEKIVENFVDTVPTCGLPGEPYNVTITANFIEHTTTFDDGRVHATFTEAGKVVATPLDGTGPSYAGTLAVWGGFNANNQEVNGTFTFNLALKGSDGSRVSHHELDHFDERPDGTVHQFFRCH